jgi:uncharacterized protein
MSRDRAEWHEVRELVARAAQVELECAIRDLPRIVPLVARDTGGALARFRFYRLKSAEDGSGGFDGAECNVRTQLAMICQRCLDEVQVPIDAHAELAFIDEEAQVARVPESHDPVVMTAGRVSLTALVEEELLLALPIVPVHADPGDCRMRPAVDTTDVATPAPTQTPFAGLRELMKK